MKKIIVLLLCAAMLLCISACGMNVKDKAGAFAMTAEELNEALEGRTESELLEWWGAPSSFFSGLYGSIWTLDERYIAVCFDYKTKTVESASCGELDEKGYIS